MRRDGDLKIKLLLFIAQEDDVPQSIMQRNVCCCRDWKTCKLSRESEIAMCGKGAWFSGGYRLLRHQLLWKGPSFDPRTLVAFAILGFFWCALSLVLLFSAALQCTTPARLHSPLALWHLWFESHLGRNAYCARGHTGYAVLGLRRCCLWLHWASSSLLGSV